MFVGLRLDFCCDEVKDLRVGNGPELKPMYMRHNQATRCKLWNKKNDKIYDDRTGRGPK